MRLSFPSFRKAKKRFQQDTDGAVTVEASIWLPFFILFLFGIVEMALLFHGQARALQVAQDANRSFSTGEFANAVETETWIKGSLAGFSDEVKAKTWINGGVITSAVQIPASDLSGNIGIFSMMADLKITVTSQQVLEF